MRSASPHREHFDGRYLSLLPGFCVLAGAAAVVDVVLAYGYWSPRGLGISRILSAVAGWVTGPGFGSGTDKMLIGAAVELGLYTLGVAFVCCVLALLRRVHRQPTPVDGVVIGVVLYLFLFDGLVPAIAYPRKLDQSTGWVAACVAVHGLLIGPMLTFGVVWIRRRVGLSTASRQKAACAS